MLFFFYIFISYVVIVTFYVWLNTCKQIVLVEIKWNLDVHSTTFVKHFPSDSTGSEWHTWFLYYAILTPISEPVQEEVTITRYATIVLNPLTKPPV